MRVWNGIIEVFEGETKTYYQDTNGLENYLISEAMARGLGGEF